MKQPKNSPCAGCSWCCEHVAVPLVNHPNVISFRKMWGLEIVYKNPNEPWMMVPNKCQHLGEDGWCKNYEQRGHPCKNYPNQWNDLYAPHCALMRSQFKKEK